jgi:MoaA/NifB/PqqE/SkfB family radical SAM enzyme
MKQYIFLPIWFLKSKFFGARKPLQSVVFISDKCNLACKHCGIYNLENPKINTYEEIRKDLEYCYSLGSRFVDFEGGEPIIWKDEKANKNINDLFRLAKEIGFFSSTVTTNAQVNFDNCEADSIWVSLDGIGKYHDAIRGKGSFDKLVKNIDSNPHQELSVNMAINTLNYQSVTETIEFAKNHKNIKSISLNFHTPFPGTEELFVDWKLRNEIIDEIIKLKKANYSIMNSVSGLRLMKDNKFEKHCWITNFVMVDHVKHSCCQAGSYNLCEKCGFCMAGEMSSVFNLKFDTIVAGMKLRLFSK